MHGVASFSLSQRPRLSFLEMLNISLDLNGDKRESFPLRLVGRVALKTAMMSLMHLCAADEERRHSLFLLACERRGMPEMVQSTF